MNRYHYKGKLWTLKDIVDIHLVSDEQLRILAFNWIEDIGSMSGKYSAHEARAIIGWIMHFFNLTEEDLKDE